MNLFCNDKKMMIQMKKIQRRFCKKSHFSFESVHSNSKIAKKITCLSFIFHMFCFRFLFSYLTLILFGLTAYHQLNKTTCSFSFFALNLFTQNQFHFLLSELPTIFCNLNTASPIPKCSPSCSKQLVSLLFLMKMKTKC